MDKRVAILAQAALFTIPQLVPAFILAPLPGVIYAAVYSFLAIGVIGGWAVMRTQSIWPSLASAVVFNATLIAIILSPGF